MLLIITEINKNLQSSKNFKTKLTVLNLSTRMESQMEMDRHFCWKCNILEMSALHIIKKYQQTLK